MESKARIIDLSGLRFGKLLVVDYNEQRNGKTYWNCVCDCGVIKAFRADGLKGGTVSCGCSLKDVSFKEDWAGKVFERLTVLGYGNCKNFAYLLCKCECGKEKYVRKSHLESGNIKSCGCYKQQRLDAMPHNSNLYKKEYKCWNKIKERIFNPNNKSYKDYGGRGIAMSDEYRYDFNAFLKDVGLAPSSNHSIERIDVNGNYEKGNLTWADKLTQANNTRSNVRLTHEGKTLTAAQWSKVCDISGHSILKRIRRGWSVSDAITKPLRQTA
jgi:hypothetical protein